MDNQTTAAVDRGERSHFFRRLDWSAFWTATVLSFAVYVYTLTPTVGLEDSGELAVAGDWLGVPHPPGYPIWTILAWLFSKAFSFVTFRGQPNPAWSIGLLSAFFGAIAAGITAMLICRSGSDMLRESRGAMHRIDSATEDTICWVGGVVGSLLFAFSPVMWSQSVIVEVYSLNAFFLTLIFLLTYRWMKQPSTKLLCATAFVFGLGLTNYQVLLLAALPLAIVILLKDMELFRDFAVVGLFYGVTLFLIKSGRLPAIEHPSDVPCFVYLTLNFVLLVLAYFLLPRGKTVALTVLLAEIGIAFYAYMPLVSDLRNPPMNWGYPRTWEGFNHAISRGQYERIRPMDVMSSLFIHQIGSYLTDLRKQFTLPVALLGFLPFTLWHVRIGERRLQALYPAVALSLVASGFVVIEEFFFPGAAMAAAYKIPIAGVILILLLGGLAIFVRQFRELLFIFLGRTPALPSQRVVAGAVGAGVVAILLFYVLALARKLGDITAPLRSGEGLEGQGAVIGVQAAGILALILTPVLLALLVFWLIRRQHEFKMAFDQNSEQWVIATLLGFLSMSIVLIVLANPKGDIQDDFIQRVKFISSHGLYALWVGYGLIFGLALAATLFPWRPVRALAIGFALLLPLTPIHENARNVDLIRRYGGAEQNGHDFGWQFGNYQLRGADAILEELAPDEEPLPNPEFPPEMGPDAIFFGGTDPGRFVPTYMIYSAKVREDVYLITQNALADNTYMSVMRDLYGDRIWIPAQPDSALAFQRYVDEIQSGKRPKNAELTIENGRVQVSGALGVMEINGILTEMIFEHNNHRHPFYVEESYVIRWMYPYLLPHGLIMEINRQPLNLTETMVRDDMDFWDWYTRRLISSAAFRRDVVARKSFSKLRSAIAGLYSARNRLSESELAFQEARHLYPLSPEANFRLAQEVLMHPSQKRFREARGLIATLYDLDPGNPTAPGFIQNLDNLLRLQARAAELEASKKAGAISSGDALELADCYLQMHESSAFLEVMRGILQNPGLESPNYYKAAVLLRKGKRYAEMNMAIELCIRTMASNTPPTVFLDMAGMYAEAKQPEKMVPVLERYVAAEPTDWKASLDLASVQATLKRSAEASAALREAVKYGGDEALAIIMKDKRFADLRQEAEARAQSLIRMPGGGAAPAP